MSLKKTIEKYSLLPNNASLLERGLELAFYQLLYEIDNPFPDLLNSAKTNAHLLPYLGQDRGVDDWISNASEQEQRINSANAWLVRRYAGTKKGLKLALESVGYDCEIESQQQPYHFSITAWRRDNALINRDVIQSIQHKIERVKSERDSYELSFALGGSQPFSLALVCDQAVQVEDCSVASLDFTAAPVFSALSVNGAVRHLVVSDFSA